MKKFSKYESDLVSENKVNVKKEEISREINAYINETLEREGITTSSDFKDYLIDKTREIMHYAISNEKPMNIE